MKKNIRLILICLAIISAAAYAGYAALRPLEIEAVPIEPIAFKAWFTEDGRVSSSEDYKVLSNVSGKVLEVMGEKDQYVEAGEVIALIESTDYKTQMEIHNKNIEGYRAKIAEAGLEERNLKDSYKASLSQLNAKLAQAESQILLSDVRGIGLVLPQEQNLILELSIEQCQTELTYAKDLFNKSKALYRQGIISKSEYEATQKTYEQAENKMDQLIQQKESNEKEISRLKKAYGEGADLNALDNKARDELNKAQVNELKSQIAALEENLAKDYKQNNVSYLNALIAAEERAVSALKDDVKDCTIVAGKSGYITSLPVKSMSAVYPQALLFTIKEAEGITVESYVATEDVVHVTPGDEVELVQKTREKDFVYKGVVTRVSPWAEEQLSPLGVIEHKVKVTISPTDEMPLVGSGYNMDVRFFTFENEDCIVVPNSAIYTFDGKDFVFVVEPEGDGKREGTVKAVQIKKEASTSYETVVSEGIEKGMLIAKNATAKGIKEKIKVSW